MKVAADQTERYFTKTDAALGGPFTVEGLESLVYLGKANPETLISRSAVGEFIPIRSSPLFPLLFPSLQPPSAPTRKPATSPLATGERQPYRLGEARFEKLNAAPGTHPKIAVHEILGDIRQREIASGRDHLQPGRFQISRRSKDFWFMFAAVNIFFVGSIILFPNPVNFVFGLAGSVFSSIGLLWSMYGVMDRY
jgi:hypothetical protein